MTYSPTSAAWLAVPQPVRMMRSTERNCSGVISRTAEFCRGVLAREPAAHRVLNGLGLLEDFLEHVVRKSPLLTSASVNSTLLTSKPLAPPRSEVISNWSA
jgi:hypothetical protein